MCRAGGRRCPGESDPQKRAERNAKRRAQRAAARAEKAKAAEASKNAVEPQGKALGAGGMSREAKAAFASRLQENGIKATMYSDCALELYHEGETLPEEIRSFDNAADASSMSALVSKPTGVLWLSPGVKSSAGKVATAWGEWTTGEQWSVPTSPTVSKAEISEGALIVELTEDDMQYLDKVLSGEKVERNLPPMALWGSSFADRMMAGDYSRPDFWGKLQEQGVDMVRVNGYSQRNYFYGWDCDSVVVLNGDAIEGWSTEEAERDGENITEAFGKVDYDLPLEK